MQAIWMRLNVWALDKPIHIDTAPNIIGGNASSCNHIGQVSGLFTRLPQPNYAPSSEPVPQVTRCASMPHSALLSTSKSKLRHYPSPRCLLFDIPAVPSSRFQTKFPTRRNFDKERPAPGSSKERALSLNDMKPAKPLSGGSSFLVFHFQFIHYLLHIRNLLRQFLHRRTPVLRSHGTFQRHHAVIYVVTDVIF